MYGNIYVAGVNNLGYGKNVEDVTMGNLQPNPKEF